MNQIRLNTAWDYSGSNLENGQFQPLAHDGVFNVMRWEPAMAKGSEARWYYLDIDGDEVMVFLLPGEYLQVERLAASAE